MKIFLPLLTVVFVTLKLLGITAVATWSWWLVLLPLYFGIALVLGIFASGMLATVGLFILGAFVSLLKRK